jgi:predicted amidohydrolase YtcJ
MHYAVNRSGPEAITLAEALKAYTYGSAYVELAEKEKGSVEEGKLADLVVLSEDPTRIDPARIKDIGVELTMMDGRIVYRAEEEEAPARAPNGAGQTTHTGPTG